MFYDETMSRFLISRVRHGVWRLFSQRLWCARTAKNRFTPRARGTRLFCRKTCRPVPRSRRRTPATRVLAKEMPARRWTTEMNRRREQTDGTCHANDRTRRRAIWTTPTRDTNGSGKYKRKSIGSPKC